MCNEEKLQKQIDELKTQVADLLWLTADSPQLGIHRAKNFRKKMEEIKNE